MTTERKRRRKGRRVTGRSAKGNARRGPVARYSTAVSTGGVNRLLNNLFQNASSSSVVK
ncbi:MAG: hypothetical protein K6U74_13335 [Firmicutes bacterium]|nr:hypothetical protein [Bacillota bacterium]